MGASNRPAPEEEGQGHRDGGKASDPGNVVPSAPSFRDGNMSGRLSPRSARMSAALSTAAKYGRLPTDRSSQHTDAFSPAFLSPRMWNEEDMLLPPSSEVPTRPIVAGRESQDKGCFGLYTFVMVLFLFQGTAAILGANYQMWRLKTVGKVVRLQAR